MLVTFKQAVEQKKTIQSYEVVEKIEAWYSSHSYGDEASKIKVNFTDGDFCYIESTTDIDRQHYLELEVYGI
ncbi:hypothetical protein D3C71_1502720 [compost metagenome]